VRAVLANPEPKLDIARLMAEKKWLLVSLSPGQLGEGPATFIGAALMYLVWSAIEGRAALPPDERPQVCLYVDELATLTSGLPFSFELLAERSRGLGAAISVSVQTVGRIPEPTRSSLLGNVATLITFRAAATESHRLAAELPPLSSRDVMSLGRFEVAARIGTGTGSAVAIVTGRTEPLPEATGQEAVIRERSAAAYGSAQPVDQAPTAASDTPREEPELGRKRRPV
jgi:hypothetical protein